MPTNVAPILESTLSPPLDTEKPSIDPVYYHMVSLNVWGNWNNVHKSTRVLKGRRRVGSSKDLSAHKLRQGRKKDPSITREKAWLSSQLIGRLAIHPRLASRPFTISKRPRIHLRNSWSNCFRIVFLAPVCPNLLSCYLTGFRTAFTLFVLSVQYVYRLAWVCPHVTWFIPKSWYSSQYLCLVVSNRR